MDLNNTIEFDEKQKILKEFVFDLAERDAKELVNYHVETLEKLYKPLKTTKMKCKYQYSLVFEWLIEMKNDERGIYKFDLLIANITYLYNSLISIMTESQISADLLNDFAELADNIRLEIARIEYSEKQVITNAEKAEEMISTAKKDIDNIASEMEEKSTKITEMSTELDRAQEELSGIEKDYVSVLGIFVSIILAFSGAMSFGSNMISNINEASTYKLVLVGCVMGIVFNSLICTLTKLVGKVWKGFKTNDVLYYVTNGTLFLIIIGDVAVYYFLR